MPHVVGRRAKNPDSSTRNTRWSGIWRTLRPLQSPMASLDPAAPSSRALSRMDNRTSSAQSNQPHLHIVTISFTATDTALHHRLSCIIHHCVSSRHIWLPNGSLEIFATYASTTSRHALVDSRRLQLIPYSALLPTFHSIPPTNHYPNRREPRYPSTHYSYTYLALTLMLVKS